MRLELGNAAPVHGEQRKATTQVELPDHLTVTQMVNTVMHRDGVWQAHSHWPPAWVEGDNDELVNAIATATGAPVGRPDDWDETNG